MWVSFTYTHIIGGFVFDRVNWEGTFLFTTLQKSMMIVKVFLILLNELLQFA